MTRPHLIKLNLTDISRAPIVFYTIFGVDILLNLLVLLTTPFLVVAVRRSGVIHRNFRWQVVLAGLYYNLGIVAR
ncbi:hypothetical protein PFISCL1PPCAC_8308, partial [Pristionchus fissidentatus]